MCQGADVLSKRKGADFHKVKGATAKQWDGAGRVPADLAPMWITDPVRVLLHRSLPALMTRGPAGALGHLLWDARGRQVIRAVGIGG